jgi:hypothetical protein
MVNDHFIYNVKIAQRKVFKPAQHFIVVAGNVVHLNAAAKHAGYLFDDLHVSCRPILFAKLPDINDVAI